MTLYLAQTANIGVNDGTINSAVGDRLQVTVSSAAASTIAISGGNGQTATAGSAVSTAPTVLVTDAMDSKHKKRYFVQITRLQKRAEKFE